ncbi:MAG: Nif3-like dinuclear metal center hexameric protein [Verrucomicrobiaceae bacterium]|nr:MAG: Nif3-like dinuclear metal center hexameric protein [Verrucomicrobiaceae bacterium]
MPANASLREIVEYCDSYLNTRSVSDYPGAHNGLQVENTGQVTRIGTAVDACEPVLAEAAARGVSLLLVHHGLFWSPKVLTGAMYRKVKTALEHDMAVYSSHLPLDLHPEVGNNVLLAKALGLKKWEPAFPSKGQPIGLKVNASVSLEDLARRLEKVLGSAPHICPGGPFKTKRIGIVTGGAGSEIAQAVAEGVDTFITGEGPHWSYTEAEEQGINVFYGGHYATETFGVKALAEHLSKRFRVPWEFIDHPTGL